MLGLYIAAVIIAAAAVAIGEYLEVGRGSPRKIKIIKKFLWICFILALLIPCEIFAIFSMNLCVIICTLGVNIILGVWLGVFLKELQEALK